jgi:hypothetical protein
VITCFSVIRNRSIILNGKALFEDRSGKLEDFLISAYSFLKIDYPKFYKMDTLSKLGLLASEVLLNDRKLAEQYGSENVSLVLSNSNASLDTDVRYMETAKTMGSPALFVYTLPNIVAGEICIRQKLKGENAFFVSSAFDPQWMADYVELAAANSDAQATLGGWVDVLGEHHDVFLYLHEKKSTGLPHTAGTLKALYSTALWNN